MIPLRVATQGLRAGLSPLAIATQGFQPLRDTIISSGGGGVSALRLQQLREDEELLAILSGLVASGALS